MIWDPGGTSAAGAGSEAPAETGGMASEPGVSAPLSGAPCSVHGADPLGTDGSRHAEGGGGAEDETGSDSESVAAPIAQASGLAGGGLPPGNAGAGGRAAGDAVPPFVGVAPKAKQLPPPATPARGYEFPRFASTDINADLSMEDLDGSIKEGPDSAAGPSGVSNELLRWLPPSMRQVLLKLMNYCVRLRCYPSKWLHGYIYLIPKPGKRDADNMRPISLVEDCLKALTRVLNVRLMDQLLASGAISANQYGFLRGRGSTIPYHILLSALEDAALQKVPIRCGTFDIQSAFCSVEAWSLQDAYQGAGISPRSCQLLGALDGTGTAQVLSVAGLTGAYNVERGVRQGECLSPLKFVLWLDAFLQHVARAYPDAGHTMLPSPVLGGAEGEMETARVCALALADDMAVVANTHSDMHAVSTCFADFLAYHAVTAKPTKTHYAGDRVPVADRHPLVMVVFDPASIPTAGPITRVDEVKMQDRKHVIRYLGGHFTVGLEWGDSGKLSKAGNPLQDGALSRITSSTFASVSRLKRRHCSLPLAVYYYQSVVLGRAGFFLSTGPVQDRTISALDTTLRKAFRRKGRLTGTSNLGVVFAGRPIGMGAHSIASLATAANVTELIVRLSSPGLEGAVARSRWHALRYPAVPCGGGSPLPLPYRLSALHI